MDWLEISVTTDAETAEAVAELFNRHVRGGAVVEAQVDSLEHELPAAPPPETVIVRGYLPLDGTAPATRRRLEEGLWHLSQIAPIPEPVIRRVGETDWTQTWKEHYHRLRVGRRIVIVPAWEAYAPGPGEIEVRLEPGMAFGTGLHPTTRLCLEALEARLEAGWAVLDVGTGSGVLAIAAAKLGAASVLALDADPVAVSTAKENVAANGVAGRVAVRHASLPGGNTVPRHFLPEDGTLDLLAGGEFDLILVNILAPVIEGMAPALAARTAAGGWLIAAGLIEDQAEDVQGALQAHGLAIVERNQEKDWVSLIARKKSDAFQGS